MSVTDYSLRTCVLTCVITSPRISYLSVPPSQQSTTDAKCCGVPDASAVLQSVPLKADSHIACRAHAVPLPCRAAKGLELSFPFDLHSAAVSDSHLPCHAHAVL